MSHMYLNIYPKTELIMNNVIKHLSVRIMILEKGSVLILV